MKKKNNSKMIMHILSVLFILLILLELQIMINYPDEFIWFVGIGALILIDVYFLVVLSVKLKDLSQVDKEEQFENISKSEKASYLLLKKCFQDLDERMYRLEGQIEPIGSAMAENEMIVQKGISQSVSDNKKVAKILLGRTKENIDALMSSNEELRRILEGFEEKLSELENKVSNGGSGKNGISEAQYQEIISSIQNLQLSLQGQGEQIMENQPGIQSVEESSEISSDEDLMAELEALEDMDLMAESSEDLMEDTEVLNDTDLMPGDISDPGLMTEDISDPGLMAEDISDTDLMAEALDLMEGLGNDKESEFSYEPDLMPDYEEDRKPKPMSALQSLRRMQGKEEIDDPVVEEKVMKPIAEEKVDEPLIEKEKVIEPVIKENEAESIVEDFIIPDFDDPNKVMSPEEIANLIANM